MQSTPLPDLWAWFIVHDESDPLKLKGTGLNDPVDPTPRQGVPCRHRWHVRHQTLEENKINNKASGRDKPLIATIDISFVCPLRDTVRRI